MYVWYVLCRNVVQAQAMTVVGWLGKWRHSRSLATRNGITVASRYSVARSVGRVDQSVKVKRWRIGGRGQGAVMVVAMLRTSSALVGWAVVEGEKKEERR